MKMGMDTVLVTVRQSAIYRSKYLRVANQQKYEQCDMIFDAGVQTLNEKGPQKYIQKRGITKYAEICDL
jgi:hypothetical protein